jgi:uncharacterized protein YqeY
MLTKEVLENDMRDALRAGDDVRKRTLRMVLTAVKIAEVDQQTSLDEPALFSILQKEAKARRETIAEAKQANRDDLIAAAEAELDLVQSYLPQPLTPQEINEIALVAIEEVGASGMEAMGKVMKILMPRVQGRADGKHVSEQVRKLLTNP